MMADKYGMLLCREKYVQWLVLPTRDARGLWDYSRGDSLHLLHGCPHGMEAPLDPHLLLGSVTDSTRRYNALDSRGDIQSIPVCPRCFFHVYDPEVLTMATTRQLRDNERWDAPWYLAPAYDAKATLWHVATFFPPNAVTQGYVFESQLRSLKDVMAFNGTPPPWSLTGYEDRGVCPDCAYKLFPELLVDPDPLAKMAA